MSLENLLRIMGEAEKGHSEDVLIGWITGAVIGHGTPSSRLRDIRRALIAYYRHNIEAAKAKGVILEFSSESLKKLEASR